MVSSHARLSRLVLAVALVIAVLGSAVPASADDWARDRATTVAYEQLDPAIRTAIAARSVVSPASPTVTAAAPANDGFAWDAAAIGFVVAIAAGLATAACVTLLRQDGRLRNA